MRFISLDVETANADMASICQIGAAKFVDGQIAEEWETYIDPKDYFFVTGTTTSGCNRGYMDGSGTHDAYPK